MLSLVTRVSNLICIQFTGIWLIMLMSMRTESGSQLTHLQLSGLAIATCILGSLQVASPIANTGNMQQLITEVE